MKGEEEDEVIVFKPTTAKKHADMSDSKLNFCQGAFSLLRLLSKVTGQITPEHLRHLFVILTSRQLF